MAKNGILIVEFANQLRDQGYSVQDAILEGAAVLRFRPVPMTTAPSTLFGAVPLVVATSGRRESRAAIGMVILGGLVFATTLTLSPDPDAVQPAGPALPNPPMPWNRPWNGKPAQGRQPVVGAVPVPAESGTACPAMSRMRQASRTTWPGTGSSVPVSVAICG